MSKVVVITATILVLLTIAAVIVYNETKQHFSGSKSLPIYIISLPDRKQSRLEPLLARIQKSPLYEVRHVYGVDGKRYVEDFGEEVKEGFLSKGQVGCWLSHVHMWRLIKDQTQPYALVLEDDALIELPAMYLQIMDIVEELPVDWSIVYLGGYYADSSGMRHVTKSVVEANSRMWHSHAYLITREGAAALLEKSEVFNNVPSVTSFANVVPVDDWMTDPRRALKIYKSEPELIGFAHDSVSDTANIT